MFKRLLVLALVAAAAWYGWKNYGSLMNIKNGEVVVVNHSGHGVDRLRVSVGNQTAVFETVEDGATARAALQPQIDGTFDLVWVARGTIGERHWTGGTATAARVMKHQFEFGGENGVTWTSEVKGSK